MRERVVRRVLSEDRRVRSLRGRIFSGLPFSRSRNAELVESEQQCLSRQTEDLGGARLVPARLLQRLKNALLLERADLGRQILRPQDRDVVARDGLDAR